jgi:hypothetical protein
MKNYKTTTSTTTTTITNELNTLIQTTHLYALLVAVVAHWLWGNYAHGANFWNYIA